MEQKVSLPEQARALAQAGRWGPARSAYKQALAESPPDPDLLVEAGFTEIEAGRPQDALDYMLKALELLPSDPDINLNVAETYRILNCPEEAQRYFERVLGVSPDDPDAHHALADLFVAAGKWEKASKHIAVAKSLAPEDPEILNLSGIMLERDGDLKEARKAFKLAVELDPQLADAWCNIGALCIQSKHFSEAIGHYERASKIRALTDQQLLNLFNAYIRLDMAEEAMQVGAQLAVAGNPEGARCRAIALRALGNFEGAEREYRNLIAQGKFQTAAYHDLGIMHRLTDSDVSKLKRLIAKGHVSDKDLPELYFALFHANVLAKNYPEAFDFLFKANTLISKKRPIDVGRMAKSTNKIIETYSHDFFQSRPKFGHSKPGPVFIVGMPRSGTTLTERILARHPQVFGGGERFDVPFAMEELDNYPDCMLNVSAELITKLGRKIHRAMFLRDERARFSTDKMPGNYGQLGLISLMLPNAKIIHCRRNPMDNCLSMFEQNFQDELNFTFSFEGLAGAYRQHDRLMEHWHQVCPIPIHTVEYESLVSDSETVVRGMLDYIGAEWDPSCLSPEKAEQSIATASVWQARQPINKGSVERWRRYEKQLQPLKEALGQE